MHCVGLEAKGGFHLIKSRRSTSVGATTARTRRSRNATEVGHSRGMDAVSTAADFIK
ncbi:MAG: hypothetical protein ACXWRZ_10245 [Bdellovibrio sp.]